MPWPITAPALELRIPPGVESRPLASDMSLTQELKTKGSWTRTFFERRFPVLSAAKADLRRRVEGSDTIGPVGTADYPWGAVGMAVDYRIRLNFPAAASLPSRWSQWVADPSIPFMVVRDASLPPPLAAESGASFQVGIYESCPWRRSAGAFFGALADLLTRTEPHRLGVGARDEELLCRFCYVLALYEQFRRTTSAWASSPLIDLGAGGGVDDLLGLCPELAVRDIAALNAAFVSSQAHLLTQEVVLNPHFGGAAPIGGDGDLIVERCYIDIKATTEPKKPSPSQWPWELLGYVLLDIDGRYQINSVGLYLARQASLVRWDLGEFVSLLAGPGRDVDLAAAKDELHAKLARLARAARAAGERQRRQAARLKELRAGQGVAQSWPTPPPPQPPPCF